jgi:hypothetical protein
MRHATAVAAIMLLPLIGCGKKPNSPEKTAEAGAIPAPAAPITATPVTFMPGKWQATSELLKMEMPGMPPEMAKAHMGQKTSFEHCITPEQAAKPPADFFNDKRNGSCTTRSFSMVGGKLDAVMSCPSQNGQGEMTMTMQGQYKPTSYEATMTMVGKGMPGGGEMTMTAKTSGKRIGECDKKVAGG